MAPTCMHEIDISTLLFLKATWGLELSKGYI